MAFRMRSLPDWGGRCRFFMTLGRKATASTSSAERSLGWLVAKRMRPQAVYAAGPFQKPGETQAGIRIAVGIDILPQKQNLPAAVFHQGAHLL